MIKLRVLRWDILLDYLSGAHVITKIHVSEGGGRRVRGDMRQETEVRKRWGLLPRSVDTSGSWKRREIAFSSGAFRRNTALPSVVDS